jgi:flagellin
MLSLHTNAAALSTQNSLGNTNKALSTSMTRLGTGYRVNSAMDDAAGLQIATRLAQTRGMSVAQKNTQNGISLLQTGEGALAEVNNMILRMKDLATEAANATSTDADKTAMQAEFTALSAEIDNIMANTKFGGQALFSAAGTFTAASTFQIGASNSETYAFNASTDLTALNTAITNLKAGAVSGTTANAAINLADLASAAVGTLRSSFGAAANRLEHVQQPGQHDPEHRSRQGPHHGRGLRQRNRQHDQQADADASFHRHAQAILQHEPDGGFAAAISCAVRQGPRPCAPRKSQPQGWLFACAYSATAPMPQPGSPRPRARHDARQRGLQLVGQAFQAAAHNDLLAQQNER